MSIKPLIEKVAIIGAGPGGLAVAIALRKLGYDVQVYEKAKDFRPVGGGLGLLPNGLNFLAAIEPGIVETIKNAGCEVSASVVKNTQGETIRTNPVNRYQDQYNQPLITIWWWNLQQILASKLPSDSIHLNHRCIGFTQDDDLVTIDFEGGKKVSTDLLIGADGINSAIRKTLIRDGEPRYLGSMSWRTVIKYHQELLNASELAFVKGNQDFMFLLNLGNDYIYWGYRQSSSDYLPSQDAAAVKLRILEQVANWGESLQALVEATPAERIFESPICDRLPLKFWSQGRVTLLGDAAHPMSPSVGQGANSTFEDAYELALCCSQASNIQEALSDYEQRRIPRTKIMQERSALGERRYFTSAHEADAQNMEEHLQMSREQFQDWVFNYKP
ncbi:MAG: NAD(P)-binding protein [Symploca sp. SIO2C1]|nr:NAD(P)-binding protein [Symploca sp. SIO2C1]